VPKLLHILSKEEAESAKRTGVYTPASLVTEGFIHCSYEHQVCRVANFLYKGQTGLVLLELDPTKLEAILVDEDLYGSGETFPHLYGALIWDAVVAKHNFPHLADGTFVLPFSLTNK